MNNPKKRNALSLSMLESLRENILAEAHSDDLRVIIISGSVFFKYSCVIKKEEDAVLTLCVCVCQPKVRYFPLDTT